MALPKERIAPSESASNGVALIQGRQWNREPAASRSRLAQRGDLERLRRRLAEPSPLEERDLLTLLSYAVGGDGNPVIGLLEDVRTTIATLSDAPASADANVLAALERRVAVALELYARATATDDR